MGITSTGIGSGLDIESLITKLMVQEQKPLTSLQTKEASYQAKLTAFGTLKGTLSQFQTAVSDLAKASTFQGTKANVADSTIASATASSSAATGTYTLEVSKLAQTQKLVAAGQASQSAAIGSGLIMIDFGTITGTLKDGKYEAGAQFSLNASASQAITINSSNNSLAGIRDAINSANIGVTASIVNDGSGTPYRLTLTSNNSGSVNSMKISVSGDAALSSLLSNDPTGTQNLSETATAQNAEFKINGIAVSKASNSVDDVISGVTLNLLKTTTTATSLSVARDTTAVTTAINSFVSAYNTLSSTLKQASAYNAETKTAAILNGEVSVRSIQTQMRSVLNTPVSGGATAYSMLSQVGVSLQKDGTLSVNSSKLQSALSSNFDDFAGLFASAGKASDSLVSFIGATANTKAGAYEVYVSKLATQGSATGTDISSSFPLTLDSSNNSLTVELDGTKDTFTLAQKSYASLSELATEIQSKINGSSIFTTAGSSVKVSESSGKLVITSNRYGSGSSIKISGDAILGLNGSPSGTGEDVSGTINGAAATGAGQVLTGAIGNAAEGLSLTITGGNANTNRGTVSYSQGFAYRLNQLATSLVGDDGPLAARTKGLNATIKRLQNDEKSVSERLVNIEKRYRAQFTALDKVMATMSTTSTYLTKQITALENLSKQTSS